MTDPSHDGLPKTPSWIGWKSYLTPTTDVTLWTVAELEHPPVVFRLTKIPNDDENNQSSRWRGPLRRVGLCGGLMQ